jgi:hypothetical protein
MGHLGAGCGSGRALIPFTAPSVVEPARAEVPTTEEEMTRGDPARMQSLRPSVSTSFKSGT